jgi:hypothetical protein
MTSNIDELISKYGKDESKFKKIVKKINTFSELCIFGKAFIENKVCRHIDYYGYFGKSPDTNGHEIEADNLAKIHMFNILTVCGQINLKKEDEEQRGYLEFYCEKELASKLKESLCKDQRIYVIDFGSVSQPKLYYNFLSGCEEEDESKAIYEENCKRKNCKLNLTRYISDGEWIYCTNAFAEEEHPRSMLDEKLPNINKILTDKNLLYIICREYGYPVNCSDILLEHIIGIK